MKTAELKKALIRLIGDCIDEKSIQETPNSFVEMDDSVIHYAGDGEDRYFKVSLEGVGEKAYWQSDDLLWGLPV